jgi:D-cysteine desulfhydrase family pyridoxal phosphate-dependent enzyme
MHWGKADFRFHDELTGKTTDPESRNFNSLGKDMDMTPFHDGLRKKLDAFDRVSLIHLPTPMRKLERLSAELGGPEIWIKRDDLTGLAFGGNKSRKLEYIIPDVLAKKSDVVVTWASLQSNWAMQTAAACVRFGIHPVLVLFKTYDLPPEIDGNMLLDRILGAEIRIRDAAKGKIVTQDFALAAANEAAAEYFVKGKKPYVVSVGGSMPMGDMDRPLGAISYLQAYRELLDQSRTFGFEPDAVVHSTGSGGTQAGLLLGAKIFSPQTRVVGISVSDERAAFAEIVRTIVTATERTLELDPVVRTDEILVFDDYLQEGYGIVNRGVAEVIRRVFRAEGVVLDPVYTSKAFMGMIDLIGKGYFRPTDRIVFIHTGGTPALFPNRKKLNEYLA